LPGGSENTAYDPDYPGYSRGVLICRDGYEIDDDPSRLDLDAMHAFLAREAYWSRGIPREVLARAVAGSVNVGVYRADAQVGFARIVTDRATFAWLCDVYILPAHRGRGLGHWLVQAVLAHPDLQGLRTILLATADAHQIYADSGFEPLADPHIWMAIKVPPGELYAAG
jgi:N-acetylglutamate synthase-like GNAT family acetyltransferase